MTCWTTFYNQYIANSNWHLHVACYYYSTIDSGHTNALPATPEIDHALRLCPGRALAEEPPAQLLEAAK